MHVSQYMLRARGKRPAYEEEGSGVSEHSAPNAGAAGFEGQPPVSHQEDFLTAHLRAMMARGAMTSQQKNIMERNVFTDLQTQQLANRRKRLHKLKMEHSNLQEEMVSRQGYIASVVCFLSGLANYVLHVCCRCVRGQRLRGWGMNVRDWRTR